MLGVSGSGIRQEVMMKLVWKKELSVGNAVIDSEHRNLINMINEIKHAIKIGERSALLHAFMMIEQWLCTHFENEEQIARAIGFSFEQHKQMQQQALREFRYMRDELMDKGDKWPAKVANRFIRSLKSWMIDDHIIKLDMLMKPALQNYDYNFLPDCGHGEAAHTAGYASPVAANGRRCGCGCGCDGRMPIG